MADQDKDPCALLIELSQISFSKGSINSAYHFLAAALHCSQAFENPQYIREVQRLINQQFDQLNAVQTTAILSGKTTIEEHIVNLYASLNKQALFQIRILDARQRYQQVTEDADMEATVS